MKAPSHFLEPLFNDMRQWRQHLHQHPETAFEEIQTAQFISDKLKSFGLDVHQGLGGTGVVASITAGDSHATIGLRADMDALPIQELNSFTTNLFITAKCTLVVMTVTQQCSSVPLATYLNNKTLTVRCGLFSNPQKKDGQGLNE